MTVRKSRNRFSRLFAMIAAGLGLAAIGVPSHAFTLFTKDAARTQIFRHATVPIVFTLHVDGSDDLTQDDSEGDAIRSAFATWVQVPGSLIQFTEAPTVTGPKDAVTSDGVNLIFFDETNATGLFGNPSIVAQTVVTTNGSGLITDADIVLNGRDHTFAVGAVSGAFDVQSVVTHEIGHLLGFDHSGILAASMSIDTAPGEVDLRTLTEDGRAAARTVYPDGSTIGTAKITGTVTFEDSGDPVDGGHVVARETSGSGAVVSAITRPDGTYDISGLLAGSYQVFVEPLDGPVSEVHLVISDLDTDFGSTSFGAPTTLTLAVGQTIGAVDIAAVPAASGGSGGSGGCSAGLSRGGSSLAMLLLLLSAMLLTARAQRYKASCSH
jgi:hypothetical protein